MAQDRINDDIFDRLNNQDDKLDKLIEDVAYMRGLMDGQKGAPITAREAGGWMSKQNVLTVAIAGLISTLTTVIANLVPK